MRRSILFAIFALVFAVSYAQTPVTKAIDFSTNDSDGNTQHLFEYLDAGKYVVLHFYFTTGNSCQKATPTINQSFHDFGCNTNNVIFIGINIGNSSSEIETYKKTYGAHYPTIASMDGGTTITNNYGVTAFPTTILIAPNHTIIKQDIWSSEALTTLVKKHGGILFPCENSAITADYPIISEPKIQSFDLEKELSVYPNPTNGITYISIDESIILQSFDCFVCDPSGKIIATRVTKEDTGQYWIDMSKLTTGIYFITILANNEKTTRKIAVY